MEAQEGCRTVVLSEIGDDWFEILGLNDLAGAMEHGVTLAGRLAQGAGAKWELRGRDLYVLAELHGIFGYASKTRLSIGRKQIVLCRECRAAEVGAVLAQAGCGDVRARGTDLGAPRGWVFVGPVSPSRSVPQVPGSDLLNLIRPLPGIEIRLEGGLWLRGNSWLAGYPPTIHVAGTMPAESEVNIDGELAQEREEGIYVTSNFDNPGSHIVWCAGKSVSYELCEPDTHWQDWNGNQSLHRVFGAGVAGIESYETLIRAPTSNPVLVGANPGEVLWCDTRPGRYWVGPVPFPVVWALPEDAMHCDRSAWRVVLVKPIPPAHSIVRREPRKGAQTRVIQWCQAIRDSNKKRLALWPADAGSEELWKAYAREARAIWRAAR